MTVHLQFPGNANMTVHLQFPDVAAQQKYLGKRFQYTVVVWAKPTYADHYDAGMDMGYQKVSVELIGIEDSPVSEAITDVSYPIAFGLHQEHLHQLYEQCWDTIIACLNGRVVSVQVIGSGGSPEPEATV